MKHLLTPEQSATLIAKGISADKASGQGERTYKTVELQNGSIKRVFDGYAPIFTLADVCSLLPKEIEQDTIMCENDVCPISMRWDKNCQKWFVGYDLVPRPVGVGVDSELIDALFSTLCWVIEKNFLKK
ncbi:hypothetical protein [uncultured Duncaniella sp.]|uniref:hypothetical protein n=1 Tax=uncultured Duncaniella sp. TaxID=2768039 RepID=UPI0022C4ABD7|nr:hypothetical protein [uncultured Duncaniella sp.]MCZ2855536.1 hypothetical protein [Candidatus Bathyarchaeota archaeon]